VRVAEEEMRVAEEETKVFYPLGHYYSPLVDTRELAREPARSQVWPQVPHPTPGIDWRGDAQIELCRNVLARQALVDFPSEQTADPHEYYSNQFVFPELDAYVLQAMLSYLKPRRMIEVGSGLSSLVTARANRELLRGQMMFTCIEPYPPPYLIHGVPGISDVRSEKIQDTPLELFDQLDANDVLFIDTSHTVKTGGDVLWIYHQIIPRLRPGVVVHMHDAFLPGEYPPAWVLEGWGWNEAYLIQSFLAFNSAFEILLGVRWLVLNHPGLLQQTFPALSPVQAQNGASLWIRRVA
jgi:predicted O-methyltransferase YrrM